jgi:CBS-domain-containing membrane protein
MPQRPISEPRRLVGGYVVGIIVGVLIHNLADIFDAHYLFDRAMTVFAGGLAVCLAVFLMTLTDTEHAPATSIALGLVINQWTFKTIGLILVGIVIISAIQRLLKPRMMDLI